jgi:hypothetical protein
VKVFQKIIDLLIKILFYICEWVQESLEVLEPAASSPPSVDYKSKLSFYHRWNDKEYNARLLCSRFKNPFMGSCMAKGLVVEKIGV